MQNLEDLPLRPRKQAQTRIALLYAAMEKLRDRTLDEIQVKDLCRAVAMSEASFFNYFPQKSDLLVYFVQIWSLDLAWRLRHEGAGLRARDAIGLVFASTASGIKENPGVMAEILSYQARLGAPPEIADVPLAERLAAFPGRVGIGDVPARGLDSLLPPLLERAVAEGDLPRDLDRDAAFLALVAVFFGVPMAVARIDPALVGPLYEQQLAIAWAGLRAAGTRASRKSRRKRAKTKKSKKGERS